MKSQDNRPANGKGSRRHYNYNEKQPLIEKLKTPAKFFGAAVLAAATIYGIGAIAPEGPESPHPGNMDEVEVIDPGFTEIGNSSGSPQSNEPISGDGAPQLVIH
jgi:hypothetical protein